MNDSEIILVAIMVLAILRAQSSTTAASMICAISFVPRRPKNHSGILHRIADLDNRLTRVEQRIERVL